MDSISRDIWMTAMMLAASPIPDIPAVYDIWLLERGSKRQGPKIGLRQKALAEIDLKLFCFSSSAFTLAGSYLTLPSSTMMRLQRLRGGPSRVVAKYRALLCDVIPAEQVLRSSCSYIYYGCYIRVKEGREGGSAERSVNKKMSSSQNCGVNRAK